MRIAMVCYPTFGGSGVVATELACALCRRGHQVELVSYDLPFRLPVACPDLHWHQVTWFNYPLMEYPPYDLALANLLVNLAKQKPIDVIHVHYAIPHAISSYLACQILNTSTPKIVTTVHGTDITLVGTDPSYLEITRFGLKKSHAVTAVSQYLQKVTWEKLDRAIPIEVIPNFLDLQRFHPKRSWNGDDKPWTLLHISNYRSVKNTLILPDILKLIKKVNPARLILIGEGPDLPVLLEKAHRLGIREDIETMGATPRIEDILPRADLLIHPSLDESFGLALLEAMATGLPVVASRVGGIPEVVLDGETGYLVPPEPQAFAEASIKILKNPALQKTMGEKGRARVEAFFSEEVVVPVYEKLYEKLLFHPSS